VNRNITKLLIIVVLFLNLQNSSGQIHSSTSAHTSYTGLSMAGYQGWFGTPNDGGTNSFRHYNGSAGFKPGSASIEYWPDMREADPDEIHTTEFIFKEGTPATVFSSVNPKTVNRHFQWMKEYGIDGAFVQRFKSDFGIRTTLDKVMLNALEGAEKNNRAIAVMYDIGANIYANGMDTASVNSTRTFHVNEVFNDWKHLVDDLGLTTRGDHQAYLYHHGKPLVALWGIGFTHRHNSTGLDMQFWIELVDKFQNDPVYGGCSILLGVPTYWLQGGNDCITGSEHTKMLELIRKVEIIMPWHTSRFNRGDMPTLYKSIVKSDLAWCNSENMDYAPCISPGIREKILQGNGYEKYREGGYYFWDMAKAAIEAGSQLLYLGMFDEIDEGTQLHKINNNPPFYSNAVPFATYGTDPEDHYLWLSGEVTRAMRGEFTMGSEYRVRASDADFQSEIFFADHDSTYDLQLIAAGSGRKVYYADPYKVEDGAPTTGTKRDTSLFKNELTSEIVTFSADQRGLYIRFVEVDEAKDEIISFRAMVVTPPVTETKDILEGFNGSFEDNLSFWRFYEVPNSLGSQAEIITGDVIHGTKAARITFVAPDINLSDRSLDNWDSNMPLKPGAGYTCKFWAKTDSPDVGHVNVTYGFFDGSRNVISEAEAWFNITDTYLEYVFSFTAPAGTAKGWLAFRWKDPINDTFAPGVVYFDHIQLLMEDKPVDIKNIVSGNIDQSMLLQNYPNPFRTSTTISYILPEYSAVQLSIYTAYGQKVADLVNQKMNAGTQEVIWNATNIEDGIYLIVLKTRSGLATKKMILSK
jgi:glycoprotein endo-alpha-1,2-mannosidase